ncbi:Tm-1-like ATP-binding domain-containing protein [Roseibium salinum]|nr:Tm-1-like ATP-binding domain-containing protein [Roseibium salinum]
MIVDLGTRAPTIEVDVSAHDVASCHPEGEGVVLGGDDRGTAVAAMGTAFSLWCRRNADNISGVISVGGGGGTSMACSGMRELPYGIPKFMVSTLASADTAPYVGTSDIVMVPSITDVAGLNRLSRVILSNAAHALLGVVTAPRPAAAEDKTAIGLTMFGVTTTCVNAITDRLRDRFDCLVFHATGIGGRSMERLLEQGFTSGIVDITTTEIADLLFGGVLAADHDRLDVIARTGAPWVGSVGALDMVNFWAPDTIPAHYRDRKILRTQSEHHPDADNRAGKTPGWVDGSVKKLNACHGPVRLLIPENGISALDIEGGAFWDPEVDAALFDALRETIEDDNRLVFLPYHINDPAFAAAVADTFEELMEPRCH